MALVLSQNVVSFFIGLNEILTMNYWFKFIIIIIIKYVFTAVAISIDLGYLSTYVHVFYRL